MEGQEMMQETQITDEKENFKVKDKQIRIDMVMFDEMREIKEEIKELTGKKSSDREISALIIRHNYWRIIKKEIVKYQVDKYEGK